MLPQITKSFISLGEKWGQKRPLWVFFFFFCCCVRVAEETPDDCKTCLFASRVFTTADNKRCISGKENNIVNGSRNSLKLLFPFPLRIRPLRHRAQTQWATTAVKWKRSGLSDLADLYRLPGRQERVFFIGRVWHFEWVWVRTCWVAFNDVGVRCNRTNPFIRCATERDPIYLFVCLVATRGKKMCLFYKFGNISKCKTGSVTVRDNDKGVVFFF